MVNQVRRLWQSPQFLSWKEKNTTAYLAHVFYMTDAEPEVGYYHAENDVMTTFVMGSTITQKPPQEVFRKDVEIKALDIEAVEVSLLKIIEQARAFQEKEYARDEAVKEIIILQHLPEGHVYNVTFITGAMKTLNMKLCAATGVVLNHKLTSLMDYTLRSDAEKQKLT